MKGDQMAWMPNAVHKNIRPGSSDPAIDVVGVILHIAVSEGKSLFDYFNGRSGGIESHFYIRRDGTIEQYRSTGYEADANYKANSFYQGGRRKGYVSVETQGMGHGDWTAAQMRSIKRLISWVHAEHDIPLRKAHTPFGGGVGYHSLHPWVWTPVAKSCPGPDRIRQFNNDILPWLANGAKERDINMDRKELIQILDERFGDLKIDDPRKGSKKVFSVGRLLWNQKRILSRIETAVTKIEKRLDDLESERG